MAKDAYYFKHEEHKRDEPKLKALIKKYGMKGYGMYWVIMEMFRETVGYKIADKHYIWNALAEQMQCEAKDVKAFVKDCVEDFELFIQEEGFFYSEDFLEQMNHLDIIRQKRVWAADKRWGNPHNES
jgi:hypothetical protein